MLRRIGDPFRGVCEDENHTGQQWERRGRRGDGVVRRRYSATTETLVQASLQARFAVLTCVSVQTTEVEVEEKYMQNREMINAERRSGLFLENRKITQRGQKDQRRDVSGRVTLQATTQRKIREK